MPRASLQSYRLVPMQLAHLEVKAEFSLSVRLFHDFLVQFDGSSFPLETYRLEASDPVALSPFSPYNLKSWASAATHLPHLPRLATHLRLLYPSSSPASALPPTLTSLKVLTNSQPAFHRARIDRELDKEAEAILLATVNTLAKLESLVVPECWRSEAVTELCEASGVALVWSTDG